MGLCDRNDGFAVAVQERFVRMEMTPVCVPLSCQHVTVKAALFSTFAKLAGEEGLVKGWKLFGHLS